MERTFPFLCAGAIAAYIGVYFLLPSLPAGVRFPRLIPPSSTSVEVLYVEINGHWSKSPDYHGLPASLFAPMLWVDDTWLRPGKWHGYDPTARQRELDFSWLERAGK